MALQDPVSPAEGVNRVHGLDEFEDRPVRRAVDFPANGGKIQGSGTGEGAVEIEKDGGLQGEKVEDIFEEIRKRKEEALKETERQREKVESIRVQESGTYEINVRRLMEEGSIIIYRDGAYYIYLPSLFAAKK